MKMKTMDGEEENLFLPKLQKKLWCVLNFWNSRKEKNAKLEGKTGVEKNRFERFKNMI